MEFIPASTFKPEDRHFYWWRNDKQGHCFVVLIRNGLVLFPGFSRHETILKHKGEYWPEPVIPPALPTIPSPLTTTDDSET